MDILSAYIQANENDYTIHDEVGRTLENYIKQQKINDVRDAIEFTIQYLEKVRHNLE